MPGIAFKNNLKQFCINIIEQRIATAKSAINDAQEAANSEEKSSAGDKYETARAMGQLARDMNAKQLVQAQKELAELNRIDLQESKIIKLGSLIQTETSIYFIAVGLV